MKSRRTNYLLLGAIVFSAVFLFVLNFDFGPIFSAGNEARDEQVFMPGRLIIPKISVDSAIIKVGVTKSGSMDVPKDPMTVGWLSTSTEAGAGEALIMDGHRGWYGRIPAVFDRLYELKIGDRIYVTGDGGRFQTFIVSSKKTYLPGENAADVFQSASVDGRRKLNLITCEGDWDASVQSYSKRLVVFASAE